MFMLCLSAYAFGQNLSADNIVDSYNSTKTNLAANATFLGTTKDVITTGNYGNITVFVLSNQNSATNGFAIAWSNNGTNFVDSTTYTIVAGTPLKISVRPPLKYYRLRYTNGTNPQTLFVLTSILHQFPIPVAGGGGGSSTGNPDSLGGKPYSYYLLKSDSTFFSTHNYVDTMRTNVYNSIGTHSGGSTDSTKFATHNYVDTARTNYYSLFAQKLAKTDSSTVYATHNYVDTARTNYYSLFGQKLAKSDSSIYASHNYIDTARTNYYTALSARIKYTDTTGLFYTKLDAKLAKSNNSVGAMTNVDTTGIADKKILKWNAATSMWKIANDSVGSGTLSADSTVFATHNYVDTMRTNVYNSIGTHSGSTDSSKFATHNYVDTARTNYYSQFGLKLGKADSTIYTSHNYVDTARTNYYSLFGQRLAKSDSTIYSSHNYVDTMRTNIYNSIGSHAGSTPDSSKFATHNYVDTARTNYYTTFAPKASPVFTTAASLNISSNNSFNINLNTTNKGRLWLATITSGFANNSVAGDVGLSVVSGGTLFLGTDNSGVNQLELRDASITTGVSTFYSTNSTFNVGKSASYQQYKVAGITHLVTQNYDYDMTFTNGTGSGYLRLESRGTPDALLGTAGEFQWGTLGSPYLVHSSAGLYQATGNIYVNSSGKYYVSTTLPLIDTARALGTATNVVPSQNAVKLYADNNKIAYTDSTTLHYVKLHPTFRLPHTWAISGTISTDTTTLYIIPMIVDSASGQTTKVVGFRGLIHSGTNAAVKLQRATSAKNYTDWTDLTSMSGTVTITGVVVSATAIQINSGDAIRPLVTSVSGTPKDMTISMYLEYSR